MAHDSHDAHDDHGHHGHDHHGHPSGVELPEVKQHNYLETRLSDRARPQWDPAKLAHQYLDDMEKRGALHLKKKRR